MKKKYQFVTTPGVDQYNMPFYNYQVEDYRANPGLLYNYPVYQGLVGPAYINGINVPLHTQKSGFFNIWPNVVQQNQAIAFGDGINQRYDIQVPIISPSPPQNPPFNMLLRGHIDPSGLQSVVSGGVIQDPPTIPSGSNSVVYNVPTSSLDAKVFITTIGADGANIVITDSGQFLRFNQNYGCLIKQGQFPGNVDTENPSLDNGYRTTLNTINYLTGHINVTFPQVIPAGNAINVNCYFFQSGLPRAMLFYDNVITLRNVPDKQYVVECDAYLTPAAYLNSNDAIQYGYMSEYIARGAARKILSDTGDQEQLNFYEPMFREQEILVWKRSQRQWTATRTQTIYSQGMSNGISANNSFSGGTI